MPTPRSELAFRTACYDALYSSRDPRLKFIRRANRHAILEIIMREWILLQREGGPNIPRSDFQEALTQRVRGVARKRQWGFAWLPIILFVAEIIIKILIEKYFSDEATQ